MGISKPRTVKSQGTIDRIIPGAERAEMRREVRGSREGKKIHTY